MLDCGGCWDVNGGGGKFLAPGGGGKVVKGFPLAFIGG